MEGTGTTLRRVSTFKYRTRKESETELGCVYMCEIKYPIAPGQGRGFHEGCGEDESWPGLLLFQHSLKTFGHGRPHFQSRQAVVILKKKAQALTQGSTSTGFLNSSHRCNYFIKLHVAQNFQINPSSAQPLWIQC